MKSFFDHASSVFYWTVIVVIIGIAFIGILYIAAWLLLYIVIFCAVALGVGLIYVLIKMLAKIFNRW